MKRRGIQQTSVGKVTPQPPPERPGAARQVSVHSLDQALAVAGLLGTEFELSILGQLGIAPEWLDACFDGGHWIELAPGRARFADPSMQLRTVECLTWSERRRWHGRIASTLEKIRASLPEVAFHYSAAHLYEKARRAWMAAARVACQAGQYGDALRSLRQALAVWPVDEAESERRNVLREIARCARNIRDLAVARNAWQELSEQAERQADWVTGLEAARQLAELSKLAGDTSSTRQYLQAAIDCARRSGDERERARSLLALAEFLIDRVRLNAAREVLQEARKAAGMAQCPALESEIIGWAGLLDAMQGRHADARAQVDAALQMALRHQLNEQVALAYRRLANLRDYDADFAGERDLHLRAIAFCRKQRMRDGANACMSCLAYAFFRTGEWKRAMDTATQVLRQTRVPPLLHTIALSVQALIATFRGERRRAARLLETSLERTRRENVVALEFHLLWAQACMAEADHELDRARHIHEEIRALWNETDDRHDAAPAFLSAAFLHSDQNDRAGIHQVLDLLHRIARDNPTAQAQAARAAVEGELAGMEGDLARSHRLFQDAVKGYDELGSPVERAMVRHRWLRALRREQRHGEADRVKKEAVGLAQSLGMRLLLEPPVLSPTITDTAGSAAAPLAGGLTR